MRHPERLDHEDALVLALVAYHVAAVGQAEAAWVLELYEGEERRG
jgi:hypothetical protein